MTLIPFVQQPSNWVTF